VWLIVIIAGIAALAVLLFFVPVDVTFFVEKDATFRLGGTVSVLFGLIRRTWEIGERRRLEEDGSTAKRKRFRRIGRSLRTVLTTRESAVKLLVCAKDMLQTVEVRELSARLRIGLGDPGDTGMLFAVLVPMTELVGLSCVDFRAEPDFEQEVIEGRCRAGLRAVPARFFRPLLPLLFSRTGRSLVQAVARG
jgi:hypothetical protein